MPTGAEDVINAITSSITVSAVSSVLVYAVGIAILFVLFWWAVRKVTRVIMSSFRRGRLTL